MNSQITKGGKLQVLKGTTTIGHRPDGRGINISGVDFWHAVEFSRNGRFLRAAFQRALRALRSFVFQAYQMFSAPFPAPDSVRLALDVSDPIRSSAPLRPQVACAATDLTACPTC